MTKPFKRKGRNTLIFKELRETHNLDQKQLAEKVGVSPSAISAYERGTVNLPDEIAEKLATKLEFTPGEKEKINLFRTAVKAAQKRHKNGDNGVVSPPSPRRKRTQGTNGQFTTEHAEKF